MGLFSEDVFDTVGVQNGDLAAFGTRLCAEFRRGSFDGYNHLEVSVNKSFFKEDLPSNRVFFRRCSKIGCFVEVISGMNGVAMARHGLILWENEATGSRKVFKYFPGLRDAIS